jgi:hypothetical protein
MTEKNISPTIAGVVIATALAVSVGFEWRAMVRGKNHPAKAPAVMTAQMCQSCHADAKMLAAIKDKQGANNTAPVFLPIGKPAPHPGLTSSSWPIK